MIPKNGVVANIEEQAPHIQQDLDTGGCKEEEGLLSYGPPSCGIHTRLRPVWLRLQKLFLIVNFDSVDHLGCIVVDF